MYAVVVRRINDASLMDEAEFLFFQTRVIFLFVNSKKRIYVIDVKDTYGNRVKRVKLGGAKAKARTKTEMVKGIELSV